MFNRDFPTTATQTASEPYAYTFSGHTIYWNCPLRRGYELALRYLRKPDRLEDDNDEPDIPDGFRAILIHGGRAGVEEYRENYDMAAINARKVEDLADDMLSRYALRQLLRPPTSTSSRKKNH